jgi:type II secretory pathway component PulJ
VLSKPSLRSEQGFLLIEALTAIVLLSVLFALFADFTSMLTTRNATLTRQAYLSTQGRDGVDQLSNELQSAMCNNTTQPVTVATTTQIQFTAPDRQQPFHLQQITYTLSGGVLSRKLATSTNTTGPPWTLGTTSPAETVVDSVQNAVVFQYYNSTGTLLPFTGGALTAAQLPTVARVTITLTLLPLASHGTGSLTTQGAATIRTWTTQTSC